MPGWSSENFDSEIINNELSLYQSDLAITGLFAVGFNQRSTDCIPFLALAAFLLNSKTV